MVAWPLLAFALLTQAAPDTVLLDFYSDACAPCKMMDPLVAQLVARGYPVKKVNVMQDPQLAARFNVTGVPCFVMLCRGREIDREVGATSQDRLKQMLDHAVAELSTEAPGPTRPAHSPKALGQSPDPVAPSDPFDMPASQPAPMAQSGAAVAGAGNGSIDRQLLNATVRLTVDDASGQSIGSGTIIDAQGGAILVLTCGHIFRESQGKGRIHVLVNTAAGPQPCAGKLHSHSFEPDLALVVVESVGAVQPARIAGAGYRPAKGESVYTAGCDFGKPATSAATRITAVDKFTGPSNVEVAGEPVQGRSGGGLFNARGELMGVCNAADQQAHEGVYAGLSSIHQMLTEKGLASVFAGPGAPAVAEHPMVSQPAAQALAGPAATPREFDQFAVAQEAALERLQESTGAEVICIVRNGAQSKSEILVLDRPSPDFMHMMTSEGRRQPRGQLTSFNVPRTPAKRAVTQPVESSDGWRSHQPR
jgi:thiol-disulfide isomerase/thioredoxin